MKYTIYAERTNIARTHRGATQFATGSTWSVPPRSNENIKLDVCFSSKRSKISKKSVLNYNLMTSCKTVVDNKKVNLVGSRPEVNLFSHPNWTKDNELRWVISYQKLLLCKWWMWLVLNDACCKLEILLAIEFHIIPLIGHFKHLLRR